MTRFVKSMILFVCTLLVMACSPEDDKNENSNNNNYENPPGWVIEDVVLSDNLKVLDDSVEVTIEASSLSFPVSQESLISHVEAGNIVAYGKDDGFLRHVVSIASDEESITFETENAALDEVIESGSISGTIPLDFSEDPSQKDGFGLDFSGEVIYDQNGIKVELPQAQFNFKPDLELKADFGWSGLEYFFVQVSGDLTGSISAKLTCTAEDTVEDVVNLYESQKFKTKVLVYGFPVVMITQLYLDAGIEVNIHGSISVEGGVEVSSPINVGAEYENGEWKAIGDHDFQLTTIGPEMDLLVTAGVRVYLRPRIVSKVYGIAGPTIAIEPYTRLNVEILPTQQWQLYGGVKGTVGVIVEMFSKVIANYEATVFEYEELLDSSGCVEVLDPVTCNDLRNQMLDDHSQQCDFQICVDGFSSCLDPCSDTESICSFNCQSQGCFDACNAQLEVCVDVCRVQTCSCWYDTYQCQIDILTVDYSALQGCCNVPVGGYCYDECVCNSLFDYYRCDYQNGQHPTEGACAE